MTGLTAMPDISAELAAIGSQRRGEDVRDAVVDALRAIIENGVWNADTEPVEGSTHPLTSGGLYSAIAGISGSMDTAVITLGTEWTGDGPVYRQTVTIAGTDETTKVDMMKNTELMRQMYNDRIYALWVQNDNGVLTAFAYGGRPTAPLTVECELTSRGAR